MEFSEEVINAGKEEILESAKKELLEKIKNFNIIKNEINILNNEVQKNNFLELEDAESKLQQAYLLIMKARQIFTGEEIIYRFYWTSGDKEGLPGISEMGIYDLHTEDMLSATTLKKSDLIFSKSIAKISSAIKNTQREMIFSIHWDNISSGLHEVESSSQRLWVVHENIFNQYISQNPGLENQKTGSYQTFNRGHIYEAFEATSNEVYGNKTEEEIKKYKQMKHFHDMYYGKYLKRDSVKGFRTGDVDLMQIKSRNASLQRVTTIKNYLNDLKKIFNREIPETKLKGKIKEMFTDPNLKKLTPQLAKNINQAIEILTKI